MILLKREQKDVEKKIILIEGDTSQLNIGLSESDRERIKDTDIIFHSAASVRFLDNIRCIINTNVRGTRDLLLLAQEMTSLKAFVYVSTAYSHCVYNKIEEKFYKPPMKTEDIIRLTEILTEDQLDLITSKLLGKWPNTYAFSKAICEDTVRQYYNAVSSVQRPVTWNIMENYVKINAFEVPTKKVFWYGSIWFNSNYYFHIFLTIFLHWIPAIIADFLLYLSGRKPIEWEFTNDNVLKLWDKLSVVDKSHFFFNVADIDWECFTNNFVRGIRVFVYKDPMDTLEESKPFYRRLIIAHYTLKWFFYVLILWFLYSLLYSLFIYIFYF
ncbi:PREDICTED: putative fatty acyl-CoA reductase CG8306 [Polistes dominula]|uniref:Fatty acyl-CoA reductase n=1 Tax=Polistes dominula TaxID=743375 RepID=A0ABM1JAU0_POLDO|nr:PREDICTED: putative fatty acyl-CoA reductase CG8306 [Polistes dominula]